MTRPNLRSLCRIALLLPALLLLTPTPADAKLAFFRNYPDLKWNVIRTEHFNVFYPETDKLFPGTWNPDTSHPIDADFTARKTAFIAEEMYPLICGQFNYYLDETVNIVMLDQTDTLTGYTVPNFDWIVVSARHSDYLWRMRGHHDWLRNVMYHEFAHVVSLKADQVFAEESFGAVIRANWYDGRGSADFDADGKADLGVSVDVRASVFLGTGDPWFWTEGGAEYYTQVAGINTWTANRDMRMRMDVLDDFLLNFDDMADYQGSNGGFDGMRHYLSGYSFALYLEERFGEGVYQSFALKREEKGWSPNWLTVIEDTLNISADDLHADWVEWAKAKYTKVHDDVMEDPAIGTRVGWDLPYWHKDSPESLEKLVDVRSLKGAARYQWRKDREKSTGVLSWGARLSPDGKWYARTVRGRAGLISVGEEDLPPFSDSRSYGDEDLADEYFFEHIAVGAGVPAVDWGFIDFSPDGSKVLTTCDEDMPRTQFAKKNANWHESHMNHDGYDWHSLCFLDLTEAEAEGRELYEEYWGELDPMAEVQRNYERLRRGLDKDETKYEAAVKAKKKMGPKSKLTHWVDWLASDHNKKGFMHFVAAGKGGRANPTLRRVAYPAWSPDGRTIAFAKYDDGTQNLWTVDFETGETTQLTDWEDGTRIEIIDFSPDGSQLVFGAYRFNMQDIYTMNVDGSMPKAITFDRFEDREPHWGHDGNIYFTSDRVDSIFNVFKLNPRLEPGRPDADLDGILDADDACPDERENFNLYKDRDGCPDGIPITVTRDKIDIGEKIFFELDSDVIKEESHDLVNAIARVILENVQIELIEIQGHTDSQGDDDYNLDLSDRRAAAVVAFLIAGGVQADRLSSAGYGEAMPLVEEETEDAYAANRRVEFSIVKQREVEELRSMMQGTSDGITLYGEDGATKAAAAAGLEAKKPVHVCGQGPEDRYLDNAYLLQVTNVVAGAFTGHLTPKGHLLYDQYQAWGWEPFGLRCEDFYNSVVDDTTLVIDQATVRFADPQEVYPDYSAVTEKVPVHSVFPRNPMLIPLITIGQATLDRPEIEVGFQFAISDALDTTSGFIVATAGENLLFYTRWDLKAAWPEFYLGGMVRSMKYSYWYDLDDDGSTETTDDRFLAAGKQRYFVGAGFAGVTLPFSDMLNIDISTFQLYVGIQGVGEGKEFRDINYRANQTVALTLRSPGMRGSGFGRINPRGGRVFTATWNPNYTQSLNEATGGVSVDDGQIFTGYGFNRFMATYSEYVSLPWKLPNGEDAGHTLQMEGQIGLVDRNVPYGDELKAGGGAGNNWRNPFASNSFFAGYEGYSLSGETSAIIHMQYRFPLARQIDTKIGDLYLESAYMQVFGTVGNLWSYRLADPENSVDYFGEKTVVDEQGRRGGQLGNEGHLIREWPGMEAEENGNFLLGDIGVEFRLRAMLFNRSQFNSSFAIAYGFNQVAGRGDVNNDGVLTNSSDPSINTRSDEKEPGGFRFYIRIGTGW